MTRITGKELIYLQVVEQIIQMEITLLIELKSLILVEPHAVLMNIQAALKKVTLVPHHVDWAMDRRWDFIKDEKHSRVKVDLMYLNIRLIMEHLASSDLLGKLVEQTRLYTKEISWQIKRKLLHLQIQQQLSFRQWMELLLETIQ